MGTISSGIGLVSGIDSKALIDQLMAIEARPRLLVERRIALLQSQKTAYLEINAKVLALKTAGGNLGDDELFETRTVTSSAESVLTATASAGAPLGTYSFTPTRLVSTHQLITSGFADSDVTPFGATTLRFESHRARLDGDTRLSNLNGGEGVSRGKIRITDRSGASAEINLTTALTLDDVISAINSSSSINVTASLDGDRLKLTDETGSTTSNLIVQEVGTGTTAASLGILGNSAGTATLTGTQINTLGEATLLDTLNDANGIGILGGGQNDLAITLRDNTTVNVSLDGATDLGDVIDKIQTASASLAVSVAADGVSLQIQDLSTPAGGTFTVAAAGSSTAAADLGILTSDGDGDGLITGDRLIATLGSKLLRNIAGGAGVTQGTIEITNRAGGATQVDLSAARSVSDVISAINAAGAGVTASLNSAGNGLLLTDTTAATASNLIVSDISGNVAASFGLNTAGGVAADTLNGGNTNLQWVSEATRLATLNGGKGVAAGKFKITDSAGVSSEVDLGQGEKTIGEVIAEINTRPVGVTASLNATGDGILLTDTAAGALTMKVEESGSSTARDLGLLGSATAGVIDGSFEKTVTVDADDTLEDVVNSINSAGILATASIINDGSPANPYRLSLVSKYSGAAGEFLFDDGGLNIGANELVAGQDSVVLFGSSDPAQALLLTGSSNTLTGTISGVTIDLHSVSTTPVQLTIGRDDQSVITTAKTLVETFNTAIDSLNKYDSYNAETEERGLLLGDSTVSQIRRRLYDLINAPITSGGQYRYLSQIGFKVSDGAKLSLDETKFKEALAADYDAVVGLLSSSTITEAEEVTGLPPGVSVPAASDTLTSIGFGLKLRDLADEITRSVDGKLTLRTETLDNQVESARDRIEQLNELLAIKRQRLEDQFIAMESALADLQSQQGALAQLAASASAFLQPAR